MSKHRAEWCRHCEEYRTYDVLPGHAETKLYGQIPDWCFCTFCGTWLPDLVVEDEEKSA